MVVGRAGGGVGVTVGIGTTGCLATEFFEVLPLDVR